MRPPRARSRSRASRSPRVPGYATACPAVPEPPPCGAYPSGARSPAPALAPALPSCAVISTNQFKNGSHIEVDGAIYRIVQFQHVKPGKGGAFVRSKLRKFDDGSVIDRTFRAGEKFRPVRTETRRMQYLYDSGEMAVFMDANDYSQLELGGDLAGDAMRWVVP